ncbi:hypothetical protein GCM10023084_76810 [Streptomyces lacrimifluminis]|uniref:Uncharacterized protein n=1 Tax=Streptomyces lacrimifluminis TaxID=1500077 RepID=A0A917P920_9ACTN|nr:hypothetical protein GCM10012282_75230 [Streptomyces lacrimifluminis]
MASPNSYDLAVKIWTERPAETDVEAVLRGYFSLLRAGRTPEAEQLIDHCPVRHVLKSLWTGSVEASADEDEASGSPAADEWEQDLSWLGELDLAGFFWGHTGSHVNVEITYRTQIIKVALGFWVRPTDAGWVITGPATYW